MSIIYFLITFDGFSLSFEEFFFLQFNVSNDF